jgi:hypothetical protein
MKYAFKYGDHPIVSSTPFNTDNQFFDSKISSIDFMVTHLKNEIEKMVNRYPQKTHKQAIEWLDAIRNS